MKQTEKRDAILLWLYNRRHEGRRNLYLKEIMEKLKIYESEQKLDNIAEKLKSDNFVDLQKIAGGQVVIHKIKPDGVDYCEQDSYSHPGQSIISLNFHGAVNSSNLLVGSNISNVSQAYIIKSEANELILKIKQILQEHEEASQNQKEELMECVNDIEDKIKANKPVLKYQLGSLINNSAGIAQLASLAIQLGQIYGYFPQ